MSPEPMLDEETGDVVLCEWWLLCANPATTTRPGPKGRLVPICDRCDAKVEALS